MRRSAAVCAAAASILAAPVARAYCPSYTPAATASGSRCAIDPAPGKNPTVDEWQPIFSRIAAGKSGWGGDGPDVADIGSGCGKPKPRELVPAHFPCALVKAIMMQESAWQQFCVPDRPASEVGAPERTIVSFDCGYGVAQVTSGMHVGETPAFDRQRVAAEAVYNMASGMRILRDKWAATPCIGDNDPDTVEHWYTATWAYNGLSYSNNPNNPNLTANRGPYDPKNGGSYAYQERVWGWMEHPPSSAHWPKLEPAYPNRGDLGTTGRPPELPDPDCASPTSCAQKRSVHKAAACGAAQPAPPPGGVGGPDASAPDDAGLAGAPPSAQGDAGCACRAGPGKSGRGAPALAVLLGIAAWRRRRVTSCESCRARTSCTARPGPRTGPTRPGTGARRPAYVRR